MKKYNFYSSVDPDMVNLRVVLEGTRNHFPNVLFADYKSQQCYLHLNGDDADFSPKLGKVAAPFEIINTLDNPKSSSPVSNLFSIQREVILMGGGSSLSKDLNKIKKPHLYKIAVNHHASSLADTVVACDYVTRSLMPKYMGTYISQWACQSDYLVDAKLHGNWWQGYSTVLALILASYIATDRVYLCGFNLFTDMPNQERQTQQLLAMYFKYFPYTNPKVKFTPMSGPLLNVAKNHIKLEGNSLFILED